MKPLPHRRTPLLVAVAAPLAALLVLAGCSSGGGGGDSASGSGAGSSPVEQPGPHPGDELALEADGRDSALSVDSAADAAERKVIAKGNVSLESDQVGDTVFHVGRIADEYGGEITERQTTTNDEGDISTARLLLRVPVAEFDEAFTDLEGVADLQSSSTGKEDVTTKVIDTQVRIRAQRRSLLRVEALLDRAQSISDIIRIESQLSRRQADLESLERRLTYLNDQTSLSTISVNISLPPKQGERSEPEEAGFLAGLADGWDALKAVGTGAATLSGRLLPFAAVLLVVGAPALVLLRRLRRRRPNGPMAGAAGGPL